MIGLTLKQLQYFDALARHKHFGRAAEACAISQPALSVQIKELEGIAGAPLVERATRQIRLTALGQAFLDRARTVLLNVGELEELMRASKGPLAGRLRLGIIPTVAPYLLPGIMTALTDRFPDLDLEVRETVTQSLINELSAAHLDLAVVALPMSEPSLQEFALFDENFVLVRPCKDQNKPVPAPQSLAMMELLLLEEGHCFRDQALSFCALNGSPAKRIMEGSSLTTLVQMVSAGMGVTLIPEMAVPIETRSADVAIARFPAPAPSRTIGMVWRKTNPLYEQLMEVGAIVRGAARR
ncbi:LysR substrate-binding domain-containing protein [Yoonia sp. SS1-5]|uniref:LysR substrate-binding domain-containing protein n=1 Tax=Yoonia rhodophyticola TaxID=3137370 RepID=A0AAN0NIM9_9RHOB